jgi:KDO2-lipid IV(A) lauroyltransferase
MTSPLAPDFDRPRSPLAHDAAFWRKLARFGAARGPEWWVRYSPSFFGWAAALAVPKARRAVHANLRRIRGIRSPLREALDVAQTFSTYAGCLAEVLSSDSKNHRRPSAVLHGEHNVDLAVAAGKGIVLVTAHTAGWEMLGPLLHRENNHSRDVVMVMRPEADERAQRLHDEARAAVGNRVSHVGDPFASLGLLRDLRAGAIVALQLDRVPPGMKTRSVTLMGAPGAIPEGPLRLAALSGAPLFPLFSARMGYREYLIDARPPIFVPRRPTEAELDAVAQQLADELGRFLRAHPTQWFDFGGPVEAKTAQNSAPNAREDAHPAPAPREDP